MAKFWAEEMDWPAGRGWLAREMAELRLSQISGKFSRFLRLRAEESSPFDS